MKLLSGVIFNPGGFSIQENNHRIVPVEWLIMHTKPACIDQREKTFSYSFLNNVNVF